MPISRDEALLRLIDHVDPIASGAGVLVHSGRELRELSENSDRLSSELTLEDVRHALAMSDEAGFRVGPVRLALEDPVRVEAGRWRHQAGLERPRVRFTLRGEIEVHVIFLHDEGPLDDEWPL